MKTCIDMICNVCIGTASNICIDWTCNICINSVSNTRMVCVSEQVGHQASHNPNQIKRLPGNHIFNGAWRGGEGGQEVS